MANGSLFDMTASLTADGVNLSGPQERSADDTPVEYFVLVMQDGAVARGRGAEVSPSWWAGAAKTQQGQLSAGPARATGVAVVGTGDPPGILTFTWSGTIELTEH